MSNELLQEIGGRILTPRDPGFNSRLPIPVPTYNGLAIQNRPSFSKAINSIHDLDPWQQRLYGLVRNGTDVLVNVNPAGGKTKPIVYAWQDSFSHDIQHDKILWVTPTVQLANQVYHVDLKEALLDRVKKWSAGVNSQFPTQLLPIEVQAAINRSHANFASDVRLNTNEINTLNNWLSGTALVLKAAGKGIGEISNYTIASVCTYHYSINILKKQNPKYIVIDELQEYVPIDPKDVKEQAQVLISILREMPKTSTLIMLTGSMNGQTSEELVEFIYKHFGRKLQIFSPTEGEGSASNRAYIAVEPHTKMKSQNDRLEIVKHGIRNKEEGSCMIMFTTKSTNIGNLYDNAIYPIAKRLTLELPQRSIRQVCGADPSNDISHTVHDIGPHPYDVNQREQHYMSLPSAIARIKGDPESPSYMASYLNFMLNQKELTFSNTSNKGMKSSAHDPFLARCILCGFAYLAGGGQKDFKMHNDDIMLVQNLFKQGKIYFLLATDMIGVGTTLTIRKLYLPDLSKFKSKQLGSQHIDPSSMVQLINRVGRQPSVAAQIYCNPDDYVEINRLLRNDPKSEVSPALFGNNMSDIERQSLSLLDKIIMMLNAIRNRF